MGDQGRPKTSTGMRGNTGLRGIAGTEEVPSAPNSILAPTPQPTNLPTKNNFNTIQTGKNGANTAKLSHDKTNESGLRSQLRRSYDANSGNLPHPHGIQPVIAGSSGQPMVRAHHNRPHSSSKMNTLPARANQPQSFVSNTMDREKERDQYPAARQEKQKGNRKRDFSKVVDLANRALQAPNQTIESADNQRSIDVSNYLSRQELQSNTPVPGQHN